MNGFDSVEEAQEQLRNRKINLETEDPHREKEAHIIRAADFATT